MEYFLEFMVRIYHYISENDRSEQHRWVAAGSYPPAAPTVPGVPHSGTRLLR